MADMQITLPGQILRLTSANSDGKFGYAVDVEGDYAIISKSGDWDDNGIYTYIFKKINDIWSPLQTLVGQGAYSHVKYGWGVKIKNEIVMVSSPRYYSDKKVLSLNGGIYVYGLSGGLFEPFNPANLNPNDVNEYGPWSPNLVTNYPAGEDALGHVLVPGPNYDGSDNVKDFIKKDDGDAQRPGFGEYFDLYYNNGVYTAVVGHVSQFAKYFYIFRHDVSDPGKGWLRWRIEPGEKNGSWFTHLDVCIYGDYVFVGCCLAWTSSNNEGKVLVYKYDDTQLFSAKWQKQADLVPITRNENEKFGIRVNVYEDYLIVATENDRALIYKKDASGNWLNTSEVIIEPTTPQANAHFGRVVDIGKIETNVYAVIGSSRYDQPRTDAGAFYLFKLVDNVWSQWFDVSGVGVRYSDATSAEYKWNSYFASSISITSNNIIVGARNHITNTPNGMSTFDGMAEIFKLVDAGPIYYTFNLTDISNNFLISPSLVTTKEVDDYLAGNIIITAFNQSESDTFFNDFSTNSNTNAVMGYIGFKIIKWAPALAEFVATSLYTIMGISNYTLTLPNVLNITQETIFDDATIVGISGGNVTPTAIEKEIFKGLKELTFRKLRQNLKGSDLETKIKDISAGDIDANIVTFITNINASLALNLSNMDLSGLNLSNADLSGAILGNTDLSGTNLSSANMQNIDASGVNMQNANVSGANMKYADVSGAFFSGANMQNIDASGANLTSANMQNADVSGAIFSGATLSGANMTHDVSGANLIGANLIGAIMQNTDISGANLVGANMQNADVSGANMQNANVSGANMQNADVSGVNLTGANLSDVNMKGAVGSNAIFSGANMQNIDASGANLTSANMQNADVSGAIFSGATLSGANMKHDVSGANLIGANLIGAIMQNIDISGANLVGANMQNVDVSGANMQNADVSGANMKSTVVSGANLSGANLQNADISGANLSGVNLKNANVSGANLSGVNLQNADISGANLSGVNMQNADVSGAILENVDFNLTDIGSLQNFANTLGTANNLPTTYQYFLGKPFESTKNLSKGSYVASTNTAGPFKDGESIAVNGIQMVFGNSISEAGLLGINTKTEGDSFTFIKDGSNLTGWGNIYQGGSVPTDISNVKSIFSTKNAKSAICNDGKVFSWGLQDEGGAAPTDLSGIINIQSNEKAFVGLYHNGNIICWGDSTTGGTTPIDVSNVIHLYSNKNSFAALQSDGSIKSWGTITDAPTAKNFIDIYSTNTTFAALDSSGNVSCWGSQTTPVDLSNVAMIYTNDDAFSALISDGTVRCWGNEANGGQTPTDISNIDYICNTNTAFTAITNSGAAICWGNAVNGGTTLTTNMDYEATIAVTADASGNFKFNGYDDSSGNLNFINNETQKEAAFVIDDNFYFNNIKSSTDDVVYISNKEYDNTTTQTFIFKTLKNIVSMDTTSNSYIKIGFIYTGGSKDYSSYRYNNIFDEADCPSYFLNNPAWMKTESKTLTLKLLSNKMTLEGHDGANIYEDTDVFGNTSTYKLVIAIQNGIIMLQNTENTSYPSPSYPSLKHDLVYKFDQSDSSNTTNTLKFSSTGSELFEYATTNVGTPGSVGAYTLLKNKDKNIKQLYPYSLENGLDAGRKHKILNFSIKTIVVTVVSSKFVFDGDANTAPTINHDTLYKFDVSDATNTSFILSFNKDNTTTDYNVNRYKTAGSAGAYVTFENNDKTNYNMYTHCKTNGIAMGANYSPIIISRMDNKDITDIDKIFATKTAFAGLRNNGSIVTWGNEGGLIPNTVENLTNKIDYDIDDYIKMSSLTQYQTNHVCIVTKSGGFWTSDKTRYNPAHATYGLKYKGISDIMSGITKMVVNYGAVAILKDDGSVISWGQKTHYTDANDDNTNFGGGSIQIHNQIKSNVIDIVNTKKAFCALKTDGTLVTWGDSVYGGDYKTKYSEITNISKIIGNGLAFAAISKTGKLYTWGKYGTASSGTWSTTSELTDSSAFDTELNSGVVDMFYNSHSGVALKDATSNYKISAWWGNTTYGDPAHATYGLRNHTGVVDVSLLDSGIKKVFSYKEGFMILKTDNKLYGYGKLMDIPTISNAKLATLVDISSVCFTSSAVAALKTDGSVIAWGTSSLGGNITDNSYGVRDKTGTQTDTLLDSNVVKIFSNAKSFCALKTNGDIVSWGDNSWGGNPATGRGSGVVNGDFQDFVKVTSIGNNRFYDDYRARGFAGLKKNGSIIVWGVASHNGYSTSDLKTSRDFVDITAGNFDQNVFVGVKSDGSVSIFGESANNGTTSQSWNASYKEGHIHLPGTVKTPVVQSTYLTTKKAAVTVTNEKFKTISATDKAFAAIKETGEVLVWGDADYGGKQSDLLGHTNFTHVFSNRGCFVGIKEDQTTLVWGNNHFGALGGPSTDITISPNLQEINQYIEPYRKSNILSEFGVNADTKKIVDYSYTSNAESNAVINVDGTVDTWGNTAFGGLTSSLNLTNVKEIITGGGSMTALKADGTTTTWKNNAVYETNKPANLNNIKKIVSGSDGMVVGLKANGTVVSWHVSSDTWDLCGNVASNNLTNLAGIVDIYASNKCFAALKYDNSLYIWGSNENSSDRIINNISSESSKLTSVKEVFVNGKVLIALKYDGTVVTIGNSNNGGDISNNDSQYKLYGTATDVADIFLNDKFALGLKNDNSCIYWGDISRNATLYNYDITAFTNIKTIVYSKDVMIGIKFDGTIVGLGEKSNGADVPKIDDAVVNVYSTTNNGFCALQTTGELVSWGNTTYGGQIF
jgi:uncharacterized protein YjbI with pentapeptide repeats